MPCVARAKQNLNSNPWRDVHGVEINVRATFGLLPVRRPILSVSRLVEKLFAVVIGNEQGSTLARTGE